MFEKIGNDTYGLQQQDMFNLHNKFCTQSLGIDIHPACQIEGSNVKLS